MTLPIQILLPVVARAASNMRDSAREQTLRETELAKIEADRQVSLAGLQVQREQQQFAASARLAEMEHQVTISGHQREVLLQMTTGQIEVTTAKLQQISDMFRDTLDFLRSHQLALIQEKQELTKQKFAPGTDVATMALIKGRQNEIDNALHDIDETAEHVLKDTVATIMAVNPGFPIPPQLSWTPFDEYE